MGLKEYPEIRKWIQKQFPSAVLRPSQVPSPDRILVDLTQKLRNAPKQRTGNEFCAWLWGFFYTLPAKHIVALMDKPSFVPPEKYAVQKSRQRQHAPSPFTAQSEFGPLGVRHEPTASWEPFDGAQVLECRAARGNLMNWIYTWCQKELRTVEQDKQICLEYEYPKGQATAVQIGPGTQIGDISGFASEAGEADIAQLHWLKHFAGRDCVDLQIDSDILCIALLHLLHTPDDELPSSWIWVASAYSWLDDDQVFCVDLIELRRVIGTEHQVRRAVLAFMLGGTDFYQHKSCISPYINFTLLRRAVCATWSGDVVGVPTSLQPFIHTQRRLIQACRETHKASITKATRAPIPTDEQLATALRDLCFNLTYWSF